MILWLYPDPSEAWMLYLCHVVHMFFQYPGALHIMNGELNHLTLRCFHLFRAFTALPLIKRRTGRLVTCLRTGLRDLWGILSSYFY